MASQPNFNQFATHGTKPTIRAMGFRPLIEKRRICCIHHDTPGQEKLRLGHSSRVRYLNSPTVLRDALISSLHKGPGMQSLDENSCA